MSDLRDMYFEECDDLLENLSGGLATLEVDPNDTDTINAMFRAVHSIKGGAGAFGLDPLIAFAHAFENAMDVLRAGAVSIDTDVMTLLFAASDHMAKLITAAQMSQDLPDAEGADILSGLEQIGGPRSDPSRSDMSDMMEDAAPVFVPITLNLEDAIADGAMIRDADVFRIEFTPNPALYQHGHDPALLLRTLERMGALDVRADTSAVIPLTSETGTLAALSWTLTLHPDDGVDLNAVQEVFEFVEGLCKLDISQIVPDNQSAQDPVQTDMAPPKDALSPDAALTGPAKKPVEAARSTSIRVDLNRVDRLINLVGELVISESMLRQSIQDLPRSESNMLSEAMGQLRQLSGVIQESVMAIRAQPVRGLFQRMSRIAREAAREADKSVRLVLEGEAVEVDKTVTERLVDPLTHMIRNAVDHGLESPADRRQAGKPEQGVIRLEAAHKSGRVVISISDDGAGINRPRVRAIAEAKDLIRPDEDLSDTDIDMLLFRPGFSTAAEVSNLSGRGVGMDVVRNEIQALGGRIALHSDIGKGTSLTISLPLTLAVMEGMLVRVAGEAMVVPTLALRETLQPMPQDIHPLCDGDKALSLNGELVPVVDLGVMLGFRPPSHDIAGQPLLLIEADSGQRTALAVDMIIDQREVVIKGLEQNYEQIPGIAAATILGDGKIALIVDTDQMIQSVIRRSGTPAPTPSSPQGVMQNV